jgi:DHA2 family multidrug resistance protein
MPDSLISKPPACVASLRYCPPSPDQLSAITGIRTGYATAPIGILAVVTAPLVGKLLTKIDPRLIVTFGMSMLAISFFMRAHLNTAATFGDVFLPLLVIGAGVPACIITMTALGVADLPPDRRAGGSGLQNFIRVLALAIGSSLSQTYWDHATRVERADLVGELSSASTNATLDTVMTQGLAHDGALHSFSSLVDLQSAMLATNDFYSAATVLIVLFTGVIWLAKRPKAPLEGGAGH